VPDNGQYNLQRHEIIHLKVGTAAPTNTDVTSIVGQHLDASQMSCAWQDSKQETLVFKVVSVVGTKTEERTYSITPRQG
jgi:hypothetical protein